MEIKDIAVSAERLDEVRGGQFIDFDQFAVQIGGNTGVSSATNSGVNAKVASGVSQGNAQNLTQSANLAAADYDIFSVKIADAVIGIPPVVLL